MTIKPGVTGGKYVSQMAAASIKNGLVYHEELIGRGFHKEDVQAFLMVLKAKYGNVKFAVFWDNAKMHTAESNRL